MDGVDLMEWRPIESAPDEEDGDYLILWDGCRVFVGRLEKDGWHDMRNTDWQDFPEEVPPTHWMPFPEPPTLPSPTDTNS